MQQQVFVVIKLRTTEINSFLFAVFIFIIFMIMKSDINKLVCILFVHLSSISLENFKDRALIIPEILELIKLHTYKFGLVYILYRQVMFKLETKSLQKQAYAIYMYYIFSWL